MDLNADHLAVVETDAGGNYVKAWRVPLVTDGKSHHQAEALIGDAVAGVVEYAREVGKPIVIENLDFRQKKAVLEGESRRYRRMLSIFSYGKVKTYFISRGYREGVEIKEVNPAYSSVVGWVKFMEQYGLTVHQAAAMVLARRLLGCSERIPRRRVCPVGNGVHIAFTVPVRKRVKHVWTYWGAISEQLSRLAGISQSGPRRVATPRQDLLEPWADQIYQWLTGDRLQMTRIQELLTVRRCAVSYPSLRRFILKRNWRRLSKTTVRMEDTPPGEVAEADFGRLGMITDPATGRRQAVWAMVIVLCHSRHCFV